MHSACLMDEVLADFQLSSGLLLTQGSMEAVNVKPKM